MDPAVASLVVLGGAVALFLWNRLPVGVVAILVALALYATGVLDAEAALSGFGDPVVIFVASLFVVSEALDATGVTTWAGLALTRRAGTGRAPLLVAIMLLVALLTAVVSPNGSVAALLPMVVVVALRNGHAVPQMLAPLAFGAHAGSLLALSGSPVNVIVSDAAVQAGAGPFGFFEYALVGLPLVVVTVAICTLLGPKLLPATGAGSPLADLSRHADVLAGHYALQDGVYPLAGVSPADVAALAFPLVLAFVFGLLGIVVVSAVVGRMLGYTVPMSVAIGLTSLYGFPGTLVLSQEAARGAGETPEEVVAIEAYVLPKMIVAGFSTVTITSVVVTSVIAATIGG